MYSIEFTNASYRILKKLDRQVQQELVGQVDRLKDNPMLGDPLKGKPYRSLHFGYKGTQYRVAYMVVPQKSLVLVVLAEKRENFYKRLEEMGL
jgi:mRNA-degrading endonuclease RelE of RelBE toxin-antitoxin system